MNCTDVHLSIGAEPGTTSPELEAHLRECEACAQFQREMLQLDAQIRRALMIDVRAPTPDVSESPAVPAAAAAAARRRPGTAAVAKASPARQWALAASLFIAIAAVLVTWGALPRHSLAADIVSHVLSEPVEGPLDHSVPENVVREVMATSGLRLDPLNTEIVFMRTCLLRGRFVPHFMVRTEDGFATVIVMPDERLKKPERFDGNGYKGLLLPDQEKGTIAVLSRSGVDADRYAREIRRAVHAVPRRRTGV